MSYDTKAQIQLKEGFKELNQSISKIRLAHDELLMKGTPYTQTYMLILTNLVNDLNNLSQRLQQDFI